MKALRFFMLPVRSPPENPRHSPQTLVSHHRGSSSASCHVCVWEGAAVHVSVSADGWRMLVLLFLLINIPCTLLGPAVGAKADLRYYSCQDEPKCLDLTSAELSWTFLPAHPVWTSSATVVLWKHNISCNNPPAAWRAHGCGSCGASLTEPNRRKFIRGVFLRRIYFVSNST